MTTTVMVRVRAATRDKLREISKREGVTAVDMLDRLVTQHEEAKLLGAFAAITPAEAADAQAELAAWDNGQWDGLDPAEDFAWVGSDEHDR